MVANDGLEAEEKFGGVIYVGYVSCLVNGLLFADGLGFGAPNGLIIAVPLPTSGLALAVWKEILGNYGGCCPLLFPVPLVEAKLN